MTIEKRKGWKCETVREKRVTIWVDHMKFARELNLLMALSAGLIAYFVDLSVHAKLMRLITGLAETQNREACWRKMVAADRGRQSVAARGYRAAPFFKPQSDRR